MITAQKEFTIEVGKKKFEYSVDKLPQDILDTIKNRYNEEIKGALNITDKLQKYETIAELKTKIKESLGKENDASEDEFSQRLGYYLQGYDEIIKQSVRENILNKKRPDGRD